MGQRCRHQHDVVGGRARAPAIISAAFEARPRVRVQHALRLAARPRRVQHQRRGRRARRTRRVDAARPSLDQGGHVVGVDAPGRVEAGRAARRPRPRPARWWIGAAIAPSRQQARYSSDGLPAVRWPARRRCHRGPRRAPASAAGQPRDRVLQHVRRPRSSPSSTTGSAAAQRRRARASRRGVRRRARSLGRSSGGARVHVTNRWAIQPGETRRPAARDVRRRRS